MKKGPFQIKSEVTLFNERIFLVTCDVLKAAFRKTLLHYFSTRMTRKKKEIYSLLFYLLTFPATAASSYITSRLERNCFVLSSQVM